jgi:hypothetical protein
MAYELFGDGQLTPARLHALLRLVARRPGLTRRELTDLLQPASLARNQNAAEVVIAEAKGLGLIDAESNSSAEVRLTVSQDAIEDIEAFRQLMASRVLGVTDSNGENYLFNLFTAWYATLDAEVLTATPDRVVAQFNEKLFAAAEGQKINDTKFAAWRPWAVFFGFGWLMSRGGRTLLVPDCSGRVLSVIDQVLVDATPIPFQEFRRRLAAICPELDGGVLYEHAAQFAQSANRGQLVSLMLSSALRALHEAGDCQLLSLADASDTWTLFPATGEPLVAVTHVSRRIDHRAK